MDKAERDLELERLGGLMFTRKEAATIVDGGDDPYLRGRLKAEAQVRSSIFDLARGGSSPAQSLAMDLITKVRIDEAAND